MLKVQYIYLILFSLNFITYSFLHNSKIINRRNNILYDIKSDLTVALKESMKNKETIRLAAVKAMRAAIKQKEVDERIEADDEICIKIFDKMIKQRKDSITSYKDAGRDDLVDIEQGEIDVIMKYMPEQLSEDEVLKIINDTITTVGASSIKDMGKVMGIVKPKIEGRADTGAVGKMIKDILNS